MLHFVLQRQQQRPDLLGYWKQTSLFCYLVATNKFMQNCSKINVIKFNYMCMFDFWWLKVAIKGIL